MTFDRQSGPVGGTTSDRPQRSLDERTILGMRRNSPVLSLLVLGGSDAVILLGVWCGLLLIRPVTSPPAILIGLILPMIAVHIVAGIISGLYLRRVLIGSGAETRLLAIVSLCTLVAAMAADLLLDRPFMRLTIFGTWLLAFVLTLAMRQVVRIVLDRQRLPCGSTSVIVVGAGSVGRSVVDQMLRNPEGDLVPVAFLDDDPTKHAFRYRGVRVLGDVAHAGEVLRRTKACGVVMAVGHPVPELFATLAEQIGDSGVWVRTIPSAAELLDGVTRSGSSFVRDLDVKDLIGRAPAPPDHSAARNLVSGRRVLVTGAGGSIGSELCRQIAKLDPAELVMLDRDESALHELQLGLTNRALLDTPNLALVDIRDREALDAVFSQHSPEIVFHAAALKHLPLLQSHPLEAWKSNVHGTQNVIDAASRHGVSTFVNISTDKAASPTSVLGRSKSIAEGLTSSAATRSGERFMSVRFGNVIGSRGSAIPAFAEQIRRGGPVTITHAKVSRFFMTIPEACALVLFAASVGEAGETMVLDLGEPVLIDDIARRLMVLMNRPCQIVYTGLRPGEKLHEELITPHEREITRRHDGVFHVRNAGIDPRELPAPDAPLEIVRAFEESVLARTADTTEVHAS